MRRCLNRNPERGGPAIPSSRFVPHRRHPSRLPVMQVVHERCAGLDVPKNNVYGCVIVLEEGMAG